MLKHATISKTSRATTRWHPQCSSASSDLNNNHKQSRNSPGALKDSLARLRPRPAAAAGQAESVIKVFAQSLGQELEYVSLAVDTHTKSGQIIKSLLNKFRLRHRDPNLYYLTLERFLRKDGLKCKSVMLLADEACPLQLQQCCSNPPHNDIKFSLLMRAGTTVKIFCTDVTPNARYKCLSLSTQTTVEETIELMLHCLNVLATGHLSHPSSPPNKLSQSGHDEPKSAAVRQSDSPSCNSSASSSSRCSSSTSSGIESEPAASSEAPSFLEIKRHREPDDLSRDSRTSSITSISSTSNRSNISASLTDQFCLVIECNDSSFKRLLRSDEHLVDVHQNLLAEAKGANSSAGGSPTDTLNPWFMIKLMRREDYAIATNNRNWLPDTNAHRNPLGASSASCKVKVTAAHRKNLPLPPPPPPPLLPERQSPARLIMSAGSALGDITSLSSMSSIRPGMSPCATLDRNSVRSSPVATQLFKPPYPPPAPPRFALATKLEELILTSSPLVTQKPTPLPPPPPPPTETRFDSQTCDADPSGATSSLDLSAQDDQDDRRMPPPPKYIFLPPIRPRKRNLSNASSTFGRPMNNINRRRYDPAQLAADLSQLDVKETETGLLLINGPQATSSVAPPSLDSLEQSVMLKHKLMVVGGTFDEQTTAHSDG